MVDYHEFTEHGTPKERRIVLNVGDWWLNRIQCDRCLDVIQSNNRHDSKSCKCGDVSIDGGSWYPRRLFKEGASFTDLSVKFSDLNEEEECEKI